MRWLLAVLALLLSGAMYRSQWARFHGGEDNSALASVGLTGLALQIGDWTGQDIALREDVRRAAKVEDLLNRLYINKSANQWAKIYAAFSTRPANMVGHKPEVCYVSAGWVLESGQKSRFKSASGIELPCRLHAFRKMLAYDERLVVLNYYVLNGNVVCTEEAFSGVKWRGPNRVDAEVRYVAQIQISSNLENSARAFAEEATESILGLLPDEQGLINDRRYSSFQDKAGTSEVSAVSVDR